MTKYNYDNQYQKTFISDFLIAELNKWGNYASCFSYVNAK